MKKYKNKIITILVISISIMLIGVNIHAHSGKTDSSGGHKDNKNKSGLGSYHYHCGGYEAHLHPNGVCPYSSSSTKTITTVPSTVTVTGIQINEKIESLEVGKSKILTVTITPSNATDNSITWKSGNESIATVSVTGEVIARKSGIVDITATSSNGKTSTIKINIKESPKIENSAIIKTSTNSKNNIINNATTNNRKDSNPLGGVILLGVLGGGSYWGYTQYRKKSKKI